MKKFARKRTAKNIIQRSPRLLTHGLKKTLDYVFTVSVFSLITAD